LGLLATVGYARLLPVDGGCIQRWSISSLTGVVSESKRKDTVSLESVGEFLPSAIEFRTMSRSFDCRNSLRIP
jgi:hypothetical protein